MSALRQSFSWWCFANKGVEPDALLEGAAKIGFTGVDLIDEELWPLAKKHGLTISAIAGHQAIWDGLNRPANAERIEKDLCGAIVKASEWKIPVLLCFSGNKDGMSDEEGYRRCGETLSKVLPVAEKAGVVLAMELLNSKIEHPDYQCDRSAWGIELCRRLGSPSMKLLYDIYHMQLMEGDIIRTIEAKHDYFAHYHTAGVPGRGQPDENQELNYAAIYRAIAKTGYKGFVSHEFVPTLDPLKALTLAFRDCDAAVAKS